MPLFLSDEEYERCSNDASLVAEKADGFIRNLHNQLETVRAQADAASITAEQTCSLLEQQYVSLSSEYAKLESQNAQLTSSLEQRLSELAQVQADKHQLHLKSIERDGEIERLRTEHSEFHKSKRQLMELLEQKDLEISEKNATIKSYLDKIVNSTENASLRDSRSNEFEAELARSKSACARLSQEKELVERHNVWLNEELNAKVDSMIQLRKTHAELEADMSTKLADLERQYNGCSSSLKRNIERVKELEMKLKSSQEELCSSKDAAATNEERFSAEISTVNKLVELYKESSEEWSQKATELEGVIKALETHLSQVESDYQEKLEKEASARKEFEKVAADLKEKLGKCEAEIEASRKSNELNLLPLSSFTTDTWVNSFETNDIVEDHHMLVPKIPSGVSGTALAASLLRDGWSLAKMYSKYQEAVDAMRHEQLGRKNSESILQRVLYELEEKAEMILDERVEHERMVDAYSLINQNLQHSLSEQANLEKTIQELKADLKRHKRDYIVAQKENVDLQNQVTVLLKECRDIQLRCGSFDRDYGDDNTMSMIAVVDMNTESDAEKVISERLLTFKDINGLVEQNVQLRSLVRSLSNQIGDRDSELKEKFEMEIKKHTDEAASKVAAVLHRAEEQGRMIESLHTSVAMYKRLYEEEHKLHSSFPQSVEGTIEGGRKELMMLLEGSQEASKNAKDKSAERVRCLEEDLAKARSEIISIRTDRDKLALEANFGRERLDGFMKEFEHQRNETNGILARNVEFSQFIVDYQRKLRESSESVQAAEELSRKLSMEVSVLKHEKEMLSNAEKRAYDEVRSLSERVYRLQASLDTIQSAAEVREEARAVERTKQEEYIKKVEREWAEAKNELQEERNNVRTLTLHREETVKSAMKQVEDMGKELADALRTVATAEARAAVAEARCSDIEKKIKSSNFEAVDIDGSDGLSSLPSDQIITELRTAKEEMEKLKLESQSNKDHMLQYKSIAQVNEAALKQMECAHEDFKIEADKLKKSLEAELSSLRQRVHELENESCLKSEEAASAAAGKGEALESAFAEIVSLKEAISGKMCQIATMEISISALKEDLEKEHQRWRAAQDNYERQVILQSETIQELTKTSQDLALLREEASELRKSADAHKFENNELKTKWEVERLLLEQLKNEAEKKFNDINEQNKILHNRVEALHIQLAEKDRNSAGRSSGSTSADPLGDSGLQNVISYLRRSKEIAETEISLLKQEKLRFQSQLENALKAAEAAEASLHAERANSRTLLFNGEEIKSLQLQVREMNLLRESNMQLREENKHNFEECQKYRDVAQKAGAEKENLESLLREREIVLEACQKEIEMQRMEKDLLEKRARELLDRCKNIDVEDYHRMKDDVKLMQINLGEKEAQMEGMRKLASETQDILSKLEQDLANSRLELKEKENRINEVEGTLRSDVEKQKKLVAQMKTRLQTLSKQKEEVSKENQALSKQLEEFRQGKRSTGDVSGEQAMKEKEEKDTRIQMLEKTVERYREESRKLKEEKAKRQEELRAEKAKRQKMETTCLNTFDRVNQEKTKFVDEFERHKEDLKRMSSLPEGTAKVEHLSGPVLDDLSTAYIAAAENSERVRQSLFGGVGGRSAVDTSSKADASSLVAITGQAAPDQTPSNLSSVGAGTSYPPAKVTEESEKKSNLPKTIVETRKTGRKLIRPRLVKPEEPQGDIEMSETEGFNNAAKLVSSNDTTLGNLILPTQPSARKRQAILSLSELHEESPIQGDTSSDMAPLLKKSKGSKSQQEGAEGQSVARSESIETMPGAEESLYPIGGFVSGLNEEVGEVDKNAIEATGEQAEEPKEPQQLDGTSEVDLLNEEDNVLEDNFNKPLETEILSNDVPNDQVEQDFHQSTVESDREEGELEPDNADFEVGVQIPIILGSPGVVEQPESMALEVSPIGDNDVLASGAENMSEAGSPEVLNDEKNDEGEIVEDTTDGSEKSNDGTDQAAETDQISEPSGTGDSPTLVEIGTSTAVETGNLREGASSIIADMEETNPVSAVENSPTTIISIGERARQRALLRQAGMPISSVGRGRGRVVVRGRGTRGRSVRGRGPTSGEQG